MGHSPGDLYNSMVNVSLVYTHIKMTLVDLGGVSLHYHKKLSMPGVAAFCSDVHFFSITLYRVRMFVKLCSSFPSPKNENKNHIVTTIVFLLLNSLLLLSLL